MENGAKSEKYGSKIRLNSKAFLNINKLSIYNLNTYNPFQKQDGLIMSEINNWIELGIVLFDKQLLYSSTAIGVFKTLRNIFLEVFFARVINSF